jgi:hypothetical protein
MKIFRRLLASQICCRSNVVRTLPPTTKRFARKYARRRAVSAPHSPAASYLGGQHKRNAELTTEAGASQAEERLVRLCSADVAGGAGPRAREGCLDGPRVHREQRYVVGSAQLD